MSRAEITTPEVIARRVGRRAVASPAAAGRVHRAAEGEGQPSHLHRRRARPRRAARPHAVLRPAGTRQDHARRADRARARREHPHHVRAGAREARRSRGHAHQPARAATSSSSTRSIACGRSSRSSSIRRWRTTRSTSACPTGPRRRRSRCRSSGSRSSARRRASACSRRRCARASGSSSGSTSIPPEDLEQIVTRTADVMKVEIDDGRRDGARAPLARHAARGEPAAAPRARLRAGEGRTGVDHPRRRATRRSQMLDVDAVRPRRHGRAHPQDDHREVRRRPGGLERPSARRSARTRTRSRRCTSPFSCRTDSCSARRAGAWRPRRRTGISAFRRQWSARGSLRSSESSLGTVRALRDLLSPLS